MSDYFLKNIEEQNDDLFIKNKYFYLYIEIISSANRKDRKKTKEGYFESHHIIPKSLGGNNSKNNLVLLTAREHYICHWLLTKFCKKDKRKMVLAFFRMNNSNIYNQKDNLYKNSKAYEYCKKELNRIPMPEETKNKIRQKRKLQVISEETKIKLSLAHKGKKKSKEHIENIKNAKKNISIETREKLSKSLKGKKCPEHTKECVRKANIGNKYSVGRIVSEATRKKMSEAHKGKKHTEEHKLKLGNSVSNNKKNKLMGALNV